MVIPCALDRKWCSFWVQCIYCKPIWTLRKGANAVQVLGVVLWSRDHAEGTYTRRVHGVRGFDIGLVLKYRKLLQGHRTVTFTYGCLSRLWAFLDPYCNTAPNIWGTQKRTIILTTTHIFLHVPAEGMPTPYRPALDALWEFLSTTRLHP